MIICKTCGESKPLSEYYIRKDTGKPRPQCSYCRNAFTLKWKKENSERARELNAASYSRNREKISERRKARYKADGDSARARVRERYYRINKEKRFIRAAEYRKKNSEKLLAAAREWRNKNRDKARANVARREAARLSATPIWADKEAIRAIYAEAVKRNMHVDHIVPLRSTIVCGLHWEQNLQLLTPAENKSKSNRFWPGMPA